MADQPVPTRLKKSTPHCNFCSRDLNFVRVMGAERSTDPVMANYEFDIFDINKGKPDARVSELHAADFDRTPNPRKFLAELELWIEDEATEVHCPFCTHTVRLIRIPTPQPSTGTTAQTAGGVQGNPFTAVLQQMQANQPTSGPFHMGVASPNYGQNQVAIRTIFDTRLSDQDLTDILSDLDDPPDSGATHSDLLDSLIDNLYN